MSAPPSCAQSGDSAPPLGLFPHHFISSGVSQRLHDSGTAGPQPLFVFGLNALDKMPRVIQQNVTAVRTNVD